MSAENGIPSQVDEAAELAELLFSKMHPQAEEEVEESEDTPEEEEDISEDEEEEIEEEDVDIKELKKWKDKYLTLQGKYNAEVPRLSSQVKDLMDRISKPAPVVEPEETKVSPIDEFTETYGEDFVNQIRKIIDMEVATKIQPVNNKIESVEDVQYKAATDSFQTYLDEKADGWRDLWDGKDKAFMTFLQQKDPMGLNTYEQYLTKFNEDWDADGMIKIFDAYKQTKQNKPNNTKERDAMIAPSRVKSSNAPSSDNKRVITSDFVKQFEVDDRKGKYSDEESMQIWGEILAAAQSGGIR